MLLGNEFILCDGLSSAVVERGILGSNPRSATFSLNLSKTFDVSESQFPYW